jgi:hypothetical protein
MVKGGGVQHIAPFTTTAGWPAGLPSEWEAGHRRSGRWRREWHGCVCLGDVSPFTYVAVADAFTFHIV